MLKRIKGKKLFILLSTLLAIFALIMLVNTLKAIFNYNKVEAQVSEIIEHEMSLDFVNEDFKEALSIRTVFVNFNVGEKGYANAAVNLTLPLLSGENKVTVYYPDNSPLGAVIIRENIYFILISIAIEALLILSRVLESKIRGNSKDNTNKRSKKSKSGRRNFEEEYRVL